VTADGAGQRTNRLADEVSPYLRQHAHNPVDWYPWGEEALERARREDLPIFLSIGYSACHWCHVMAHESFEDTETAALMNERYVNIKVDREERPDLDEVYMSAIQLITRQGGWPMSVFLTPGLEPYFGGTYYPPEDRHGMPSFRTVLRSASDAYRERRDEVVQNAKTLAEEVRQVSAVGRAAGEPDATLIDSAYHRIAAGFDHVNGGFGHAPKFPSTMSLSLCLRRWAATADVTARSIVSTSLERMSAGGLRDHLGGGFHRYSVDARWLVPHFEKMLYDNALLVRLYVEAWQAIGEPRFRTVAAETLSWVRREMTQPGGGFHATIDADSEGVEGRFYVWTPEQVEAVLGAEDGALFGQVYGVTTRGNFEGRTSILHLEQGLDERARAASLEPAELEARLAGMRARLLTARAERVAPVRDDKILVAWNGLMLSSMAFAARALDSEADRAVAVETGEYLWRELRPDGRLAHATIGGRLQTGAYLDDVAALAGAYVDLYHATFDGRWIDRACALADELIEAFADDDKGGFFFTAGDAERLIARSKNPYDNAVPGGNALAVDALLRLAALTADAGYEEAAARTVRLFRGEMERVPQAFPHLLEGAAARLAGPRQVVIAGDAADERTQKLVAATFAVYDPDRVVIHVPPDGAVGPRLSKVIEGKGPVGEQPAAWVCRRFSCERPIITPDELGDALVSAPIGAMAGAGSE